MEDFIYIIALIAWVLYAFYRKSQKKAGAGKEQPGREPRPQQGPLPTLEEIFMGKEEEPEPEYFPEPVPATVNTDGVPPVLRETAFEREYNLRGISSYEEMDKPMSMTVYHRDEIQKHEIGHEEIEAVNKGVEIDLKKAVIYAEILNRPYV